MSGWMSERDASIGVWLNIASPHVAEIASRAGYDFACIDAQHGMIGEADAFAMIQAIEAGDARPVVRAPWRDPASLGKYLDMGADAVIIPMIDRLEQAQRAVEACRYPPLGRRSYGPSGAAMRRADYFVNANEMIGVHVMIETTGALEACDEIASLPGLSGLFVGPADLSISLGLAPAKDNADPAFENAISTILKACRKHGKIAGIQADQSLVSKRIAQGFTFVTAAMDNVDLEVTFKNTIKKARGT